jgi:hypothetical protein
MISVRNKKFYHLKHTHRETEFLGQVLTFCIPITRKHDYFVRKSSSFVMSSTGNDKIPEQPKTS